MTEKKTSEAQLKASANWQKKNPEHMKYIRAKSAARSFIRNLSTSDDLAELEQLIAERKKALSTD